MSHRGSPKVTVLMPVRNAGPFITESVRSILAQTEPDFTYLILDDGSDDNSIEIAERLADHRTRIVRDGLRLGLTARLNWGLDNAGTKFVARMDADDISAPFRLSRLLAFMQAHPRIGICGSWYRRFGIGMPPEDMKLPLDNEHLRAMTLFASPFGHPTVIFNLRHLDSAGLRYSKTATHAEDYDLWERAASKLIFANIPEYLLFYRVHPGQMSVVHHGKQVETSNRIRARALFRHGFNPTPDEIALHCDYVNNTGMKPVMRLQAALAWFEKLACKARAMDDVAVANVCMKHATDLKTRIAKISPFRRYLGAWIGY